MNDWLLFALAIWKCGLMTLLLPALLLGFWYEQKQGKGKAGKVIEFPKVKIRKKVA